jgi:ABC-type glycerol-3-phosphate transport system substrate-binding protein
MKKIILFSLLILIAVSLSGCLKKKQTKINSITLEVWGVFDDSDVINTLGGEFTKRNPYVKEIKYKKIASNITDFEEQFVNAMANGTGPDIIYFKNSWLPKHGDKIIPMPNSEQALSTFKNQFVDVAYDDFVYKNDIYAKPLYCDTLALYYNNDLLNQVGIVSPPKTWDELKKDVELLTKIDDYGNIKQSGIALGRAKSPAAINRAGDILMLMMMQDGGIMNEGDKKLIADFNSSKFENVSPGEEALKFYASFADGSSPYYTWNTKQDYSIDSFRYGRTAMMINYSYWYDRLKRSDPKLDFNIAPVPQVSLNKNNKVNYANYWGLAVANNRRIEGSAEKNRITQAWKYINFMTNTASQNGGYDAMAEYLQLTHKPPVRRDLIEAMKNDLTMGVFAQQALTAKSWRQVDNDAIDKIFVDMIDSINRGAIAIGEAVKTAEERVNALVRAKSN